ncbi:MAG TPA: MazG family protein, partial [Rhodospirillales bacterium]|nr:MazG family protein [Rhodospirillales bacterium]
WEELKAAERERKAARTGGRPSALDDLPRSLPALMRALKLQERAARVGFDWPEATEILDKIEEEVGELRAELASDGDPQARRMEVGDLLFTLVNLARRLEVDPETALRLANGKFERRFRAMETAAAARGRRLEELAPEELEALWEEAKTAERDDQ